MNGSPTCTVGRRCSFSSPKDSDAIVAPWMPSRPVFEPTYITGLPMPLAIPVKIFFFLTMPRVNALTRDVGVVALVEITLAADGGHADAVAVTADAGDHAGQQVPCARMIDGAEAQRVERRDGPRAHGEDIPQDAADAGRGALVRLNE